MDRCSYILTYTYKVDFFNQGCRGRILKHSEIFDYAKANNCLLILQHIICAGESGRISGWYLTTRETTGRIACLLI